jgi:hypothetical protein
VFFGVAGAAGGLIVAVAAGAMEGEGRTLVGGEAIAFGDAVAAGAFTEAEGALAGVAEGEAATDGAMEGVALGVAAGDGRTLGEGDAAGVGLAPVLVVAAGVALGATVAEGDGRTLGEEEEAGVGLAAGLVVAAGVALGAAVAEGDGRILGEEEGAGVALAAAVAAAVAAGATGAVEASVGFTKFFGGALGGGVASALILVRARSAAERSAMAVQPLSIVTSVTRSFTMRGRGISGISTITGTDTSSSSPRMVADTPSTFCRRKR